ncbi:MAG: hypothetical protein ACLQU5_21810 [Isosphaeraceae bacterium]
MSPNQLREAIRHQPFRPFEIVLEDGRRLCIDHPEFIAVSRTGRELTFYGEQDRQHWLDARLIRELVILPVPENQPAPSRTDKEGGG